jgi:TIR domain
MPNALNRQLINVFLSHSFKDKPFVRMLANDIKKSGVSIWIDEMELLPGDSIIRKISQGIVDSSYVVACLSKISVESNWVKEELEIAATMGINGNRIMVVPLLLEDCVIPAFLINRLYVDFRKAIQYDEAFRQLLRRLNPEALPETAYSVYSLTITAERKKRLVETAKDPQMKEWALDYLIGTLGQRERHTERHFIYLALGEIKGERAAAAVKQGLSDANDFARSGAEKALELLRH